MDTWFFVSDLHGKPHRYRRLFAAIEAERPRAVCFGGDLLPSAGAADWRQELGSDDFVEGYLRGQCERLLASLGAAYPAMLFILGNDDGRYDEDAFRSIAVSGLWHYVHGRRVDVDGWSVYGYSYVPPTPFQLKDFERYDVSRYVDPGCVPPDGGRHSSTPSLDVVQWRTIAEDLADLVGDDSLDRAVVLCHAPPYRTALDRADLDGVFVDHVPVDVNVGSVALRRFIEERQPAVTLHGHVHEAARLSGTWRDRIGRTHLFGAAHDGPELALVRLSPDEPAAATRELL